jgi:hypothetical protein
MKNNPPVDLNARHPERSRGISGMKKKGAPLIECWFERYVATFAQGGSLPFLLQLKYDHSLRVAENCRTLALHSGWSAEEVETAYLVGLLHDTGRFSQFREYRTFLDRNSVDHAARGTQILHTFNVLHDLPSARRRLVHEAVSLHNRKILPPALKPLIARYASLIRDADKIDIFRVVLDAIDDGSIALMPELTFQLDLKGPLSPDTLVCLRERKAIAYEQIRSLNDLVVLLLSWIYELSFEASRDLIRVAKVPDRIRAFLPSGEEIDAGCRAAWDWMRTGPAVYKVHKK